MGTNNIGSKEDCAFMRIRSVFMHSHIALYYIAWSNLIHTLYFKLNVRLPYLPISLIRDFFLLCLTGLKIRIVLASMLQAQVFEMEMQRLIAANSIQHFSNGSNCDFRQQS